MPTGRRILVTEVAARQDAADKLFADEVMPRLVKIDGIEDSLTSLKETVAVNGERVENIQAILVAAGLSNGTGVALAKADFLVSVLNKGAAQHQREVVSRAFWAQVRADIAPWFRWVSIPETILGKLAILIPIAAGAFAIWQFFHPHG